TLKIDYNRGHGIIIKVSPAQSDRVPQEYQRRQTLKNAERYIIPERKEWEDKVLSAQERSLAREKQLYDELLLELQGYVGAVSGAAQALAELDALGALAHHAHKHNWVRPELSKIGRAHV